MFEVKNSMLQQPKFQDLLTQLSTNTALRKQYREYPEEVCKAFGLSDAETTQFQQLKDSVYNKFALNLIHNRLKHAKHYIPGVCQLLGSDLIDKFTMYCQRFPTAIDMEGPHEAIQFLQFLTYYSDYPIPGYPYSNEVIEYEQTRLELLIETPMNAHSLESNDVLEKLQVANWKEYMPKILPQIFVKEYNYPIDEIIEKLLNGEKVNPEPGAYWVLFVRLQTRNQVIVKRIKKSTKLLITQCDGETAINDIIENVRTEIKLKMHEHVQFEKECRYFLKKLAREGFLALTGRKEPATFEPMRT